MKNKSTGEIMKIPLEFNPTGDRIFVIVTIIVDGKILPVKFVVDTGSNKTFIPETSAAKVRIFTKNLELEESVLMGGTKVNLYKLGKVIMNFRNEKGEIESIGFSNLKVAESAWTRKGVVSAEVAILGMDFLLENKLHLFVDPSKREGYIGR